LHLSPTAFNILWTGIQPAIEMIDKKKYIIILSLLVLTGCSEKNPTANVGDRVTITADKPGENQDLDFIWEWTRVPDNSQVDNSKIMKDETNATIEFIPDVAGLYSLEVSIFQYNDEISTQSFSYEVLANEIVEKEQEDKIKTETTVEVEDAVAELLVENNEPKWYESESVAAAVEEASQTTEVPVVALEEPKAPPSPPPATTAKPKKIKAKLIRGSSIPYDKERFTIQVASKKELADAKKVVATLIDAGFDAYIQKAVFKETNEIWYRVRVGSYDNRDTAVAVAESLSSTRLERAWVDFVRYEY
jgi:cell division septation protein DedD